MPRLPPILFLLLAACQGDQSVAAFGAGDTLWKLQEIDRKPFDAHATLRFEGRGRIAGQAPCNRYRGRMNAPYPWFEATGITTTKTACPALAREAAFLGSLGRMTLAEVAGGTLILSDDKGRQMVFTAVPR